MTANVGRRDAAIIVSGYSFGENGSLPRVFLSRIELSRRWMMSSGPSVAALGTSCRFGLR